MDVELDVDVCLVDEVRFAVMGTWCHVQVVDGPNGCVELVESRLRADEARWSRFLPDSELSQLNAGRVAADVSAETAALVEAALAAREATGGWFDPEIGAAVIRAGYDRSFELLSAPDAPVPERPGAAAPGDRRLLDLGGIAKGWAADRAAEAVMGLGAAGVCVNVGGDLRVLGRSPEDGGWWSELDHFDRPVGLTTGALATSGTRRRSWVDHTGVPAHHLIDPRTERPGTGPFCAASVVAADAATAEVLTKVVLLAPEATAAAILARHAASAVATTVDGHAVLFGSMESFL